MATHTSPKLLLRRALHRFGYDIVRFRGAHRAGYATIAPHATYAPWLKDAAFLAIYNTIRAHTLVDQYRCYELWTLVAQSKKLSGSLIEIGVWRGGTGALIAQQAKRSGIGDRVYLCDTFAGVVKASTKDSDYSGGEHADTSRPLVESLLSSLALDNVTILQGTFPEHTASQIDDNTCFRFCHIDVDAYQSAKDCVDWLWPRLTVGGIIVYDDFGFEHCDGIARYVEEQLPEPDRVIIQNLNGHAVVIKLG